MEIKRLNDNQIRCAFTEDEIQSMGFEIEDIISNADTVRRFMKVVLAMVEKTESIDIEALDATVKAELLQDHSMAFTFGGSSKAGQKKTARICGEVFSSMEDVLCYSRRVQAEKYPASSLYRYQEQYILIVDYKDMAREELCPFVMGALEYNTEHLSEEGRVAYIREHGTCIISSHALELLLEIS